MRVNWRDWSLLYNLAVLLSEGTVSWKNTSTVFSAPKVRTANMNFLHRLCMTYTHIHVAHAWKPFETRFQTKIISDVSLTPEVEGVTWPPRSGLIPTLTHIHVPHASKPLETTFQTKLIFDVLLTPEVGGGHMTPLEMVWDWFTLISVFPMPENHWKRIFSQK